MRIKTKVNKDDAIAGCIAGLVVFALAFVLGVGVCAVAVAAVWNGALAPVLGLASLTFWQCAGFGFGPWFLFVCAKQVFGGAS